MKRTGLGRILWWAAPILLAVGIASRAADLREIAASLVGVKPGWVAAALLLGVLFTLNQGALYRAIFRLFDVRISLRESVRLALVMAFGSLAPAGTVAGIAYFVSTAREHGIPGPRAILTSLAFYLFDYGALLPVVAAGVTVLLTHHGAEVRLVTAGGIVLLITAAAGGALLWGLADGRALGTASRLASAINVLIARLHRRPVDRRRAAARAPRARPRRPAGRGARPAAGAGGGRRAAGPPGGRGGRGSPPGGRGGRGRGAGRGGGGAGPAEEKRGGKREGRRGTRDFFV